MGGAQLETSPLLTTLHRVEGAIHAPGGGKQSISLRCGPRCELQGPAWQDTHAKVA